VGRIQARIRRNEDDPAGSPAGPNKIAADGMVNQDLAPASAGSGARS
jgi:hypothetical protein